MFTGLIEAVGRVSSVQLQPQFARVSIAARWPDPQEPVLIGDSIAVSGCCLTAVAVHAAAGQQAELVFELSHETLSKTTFGQLQPGARVNLERALRLGARLGGHIVTGHVDGTGRLEQIARNGEAFDVVWSVPANLEPELVQKGSIAVDGVSLTVNALTPGHFSATIIPHTVAHTQLLDGGPGKAVHLETDVLAKHVRRLLSFGQIPV